MDQERPPGIETGPDRSAIEGVLEFRRRVVALGFGIITLAILSLLVAIYLQLATPILWGLVLSVLFFPLHRAILRLVRGHSAVASVLSTALSLAIIFFPSGVIVLNLVDEVQNLWPRIQGSLGPETFEMLSGRIQASPLRGVVHWLLGGDSDLGAAGLEMELQRAALDLQEFLQQQLRNITRSAPSAILQGAVTVIVFFFFLLHGPGWVKGAQRAMPLAPEHADRLFSIAERTLNAVFRGVIITALSQAVLAGIGYWAVGAPTPLLLAFVTFVAALIPFVGPVAVWIPVALGLAITGRIGAAIGLAVWGTLVVSLVDNIVRPYLIGKETRLPVLWLFLVILGGLKLFGFLGLLVGPIALALATACYRIYKDTRRVTA
jgi:predicted PurR-regulated permease PerM